MSEQSHETPYERMRHLLKGNESPAPRRVTTKAPEKSTAQLPADGKPPRPSRGERFLRAFWTLASLVSMTVNLVALIVLLVLWQNASLILPTAEGLGESLLGGLYGNFVKMDEAHITTSIPVESSIRVAFTLPVETETNVVLTQDVVIANAHVVINTPLFNINAPTTVTLPKGTSLPISLSITVPVDTDVPVHLDVPVDIPLAETDLHDPFVGLQNVIKPYYCLLMPSAELWDGRPVCQP